MTEERFVNIDEKCDVSLTNYHLFNEEINFVQDDLLLNTVNFDLLDNFVHKNTEYNCSNSIAEFDDDLIVSFFGLWIFENSFHYCLLIFLERQF